MKRMITLRLPADIDERLTALAKRTGRTKAYYAREAILRLIDDMEDTYIAIDRLDNSKRHFSMAEAEEELDIED